MFKNYIYVIKSVGLRSFLKTINFTLRVLDRSYLKTLPILIHYKVKLLSKSGNIKLERNKTGIVKIGFGKINIFDRKFERTTLELLPNSKLVFKGCAHLGHGTRLSVHSNAYLEFGNNFYVTANTTIVCSTKIIFGNNNLISWQNQIIDTDFHKIYCDNLQINKNKPIVIGNNNWFGSRVEVLKGVTIGNNNVIALGSLITKEFSKNNTLIAGRPAKVVKNNITWER